MSIYYPEPWHRARVLTSPRRFETWDAAVWFAEFRATRIATRQRIVRDVGLGGLPVWTVFCIHEGVPA